MQEERFSRNEHYSHSYIDVPSRPSTQIQILVEYQKVIIQYDETHLFHDTRYPDLDAVCAYLPRSILR